VFHTTKYIVVVCGFKTRMATKQALELLQAVDSCVNVRSLSQTLNEVVFNIAINIL